MKLTDRWQGHLLGLCASVPLALFAVTTVDEAEPPGSPAPAVPRRATAAEQLRLAQDARIAARDASASEWRARIDYAAQAFRAVRAYFPSERELGAEASFRAGDLARIAGDTALAKVEYASARELGAGTAFQARAGLELGHMHRRAHDFEGAIEHYRAVADDDRAARAHRDDALLWIGRALVELARVDEARRTWRIVADRADSPLDRIQAFDYLALASIDAADLEGAAGFVDQCRQALGDVAAEETPLGERVRNALQRMRAVLQLERAIAARERGVVLDKEP